MNSELILTINSGSSSLKFSLYETTTPLTDACFKGVIRNIGENAVFDILTSPGEGSSSWNIEAHSPEQALHQVLLWLEQHPLKPRIVAVGHRMVHGGNLFYSPQTLTRDLVHQLESISDLAPLHMPHNLAAVYTIWEMHPNLPQVACFDTAFHQHMPEVEKQFAIPQRWRDLGVRRYGFHGLSYEYIAGVLPDYLGDTADMRIIVAHLGSGASLCAMHNRQSVATTMSFTPLDGIPMATRPGQLDPSTLLYLRRHGVSDKAIEQGLNFESGMLGLSRISGDLSQLSENSSPAAQLAVAYFIHHTHRAIGSLTAVLGGLDALIFTAGIGENSAYIRQQLCKQGAWLGLQLDEDANLKGHGQISPVNSTPSVWVIPTNEELMVAQHTLRTIV